MAAPMGDSAPVLEERFYRIGEVAELLNVKDSTLRFWEKEFPQLNPSRSRNGQRVYTEDDVAMFRRIQQLLHEIGLTINGARRVLEGSAVIDESLPEKVAPIPDPDFMHMLKTELSSIRKLLTGGLPK